MAEAEKMQRDKPLKRLRGRVGCPVEGPTVVRIDSHRT